MAAKKQVKVKVKKFDVRDIPEPKRVKVKDFDESKFTKVNAGAFAPIWKPEEGQTTYFVPTGIHEGPNGFLIDGVLAKETDTIYVSKSETADVKKGDAICIPASAALQESENSFGLRLFTEDNEPSKLLQTCIDQEEVIMLVYHGKVKSKSHRGQSTKTFDVFVSEDVKNSL